MEKQKCYCAQQKDATSKLVFKEGDLYYCGSNECKEKIEKEIREENERSMYQGRTFSQYKSSATILHYTFLVGIGLILGYFFYRLISLL